MARWLVQWENELFLWGWESLRHEMHGVYTHFFLYIWNSSVNSAINSGGENEREYNDVSISSNIGTTVVVL